MNKTDNIDPFFSRYRGAFTSLLKWPDLEAFWQILLSQADRGWYVYRTSEVPPEHTVTAEEFKKLVGEIDHYLRQEHKVDYCGIVYTDNKAEPEYIKVYDPNNLGVVCGIGREPIFPGWIISLLPPKSLQDLPPLMNEAKSWWRRVLPFG